jgi:oligoribonuclease (3'-5' exoribonuclease)
MKISNDRAMVWIDMETTGLSAQDDVPLELGLAISDEWGKIYASIKWLVWEDAKDFQMGIKRGRDWSFVNDMHTKSGLWRDLEGFETDVRAAVDADAVRWLKENGVEKDQLPLAGSSIGSLDRPFCLIHFPELNEFLSYRNIDISTIKELCKRNNPELYQNLEPLIGTKADATHRVLDDIDASIREYQVYCDEYLITADR